MSVPKERRSRLARVMVDLPKRDEGRAPRTWPKYMTARVAADYCDSSPWTIRRHVQPCGRRGRMFVYSIESIEAWMQGTAIGLKRSASQ